jgi:chemotaxis response regulator CheB
MTSSSKTPPIGNSQSKRVLIVEDEPLIAYDLRTEIEENNHDVVGLCDSASSAVAMAENFRPDVIVMDINLLGHQSGLEAGREIRERFDIGCVYVSATLDRVDPEIWNDIRPIALIRKPYRDEALATAISNDGANWEKIESSGKAGSPDQTQPDTKLSGKGQLQSEPVSPSKSPPKTT